MTDLECRPSSDVRSLDGVELGLPRPVWIWGVPILPVTLPEAVEVAHQLILFRKPSVLITANVHYAMLTARDERLRMVNARAAGIFGDGAPLVWAGRRQRTPLPERVTGADLTPALCQLAARCGHRVFLLGGSEGVATRAARSLERRFPGLAIVGVAAPHLGSDDDPVPTELLGQIHRARPDLLFAALGQPKGELWLTRHCKTLNVPVSMQIGGTFDFIAGAVPRAPGWMQRSGLEWAYRLNHEPRRLAGRYLQNALFLGHCLFREMLGQEHSRRWMDHTEVVET